MLSMDSFSQVILRGNSVLAFESLIKSESLISECRTVRAHRIITANKLWEYFICINTSPPPVSLLCSHSLWSCLSSQRLANFALGCNFGSQENAPRLHNLVSRATVVTQLQPGSRSPRRRGANEVSAFFHGCSKEMNAFHSTAAHKGEHQEGFHMCDKHTLKALRVNMQHCFAALFVRTGKAKSTQQTAVCMDFRGVQSEVELVKVWVRGLKLKSVS